MSDSSQSPNKKNPLQDLITLFECPVCFDYALPPIHQCQKGHIVCSFCRPKLTFCPTCRGPLGNIRNLGMEKVADSILFPCRFASTGGCERLLNHKDKLSHEETCKFRPYECPCPGLICRWEGTLEQVIPHILSSHRSITVLHGEDIVFLATDIDVCGAVDWVMMQCCFGYHFILILEKKKRGIVSGENMTTVILQQYYACVQIIGTSKQAKLFEYKLELNGPGKRRLIWEASPRSIHDGGMESAIKNCDCLIFDSDTARSFSENGNLPINVTISLC